LHVRANLMRSLSVRYRAMIDVISPGKEAATPPDSDLL
jgi:hypothetical protein